MSVFQHPHLTRGIVKTSKGAFVITRGLVEVPDEIGESLGWRPVGLDQQAPADVSGSHSTEAAHRTGNRRAGSRARRARASRIRVKPATRKSRAPEPPTE